MTKSPLPKETTILSIYPCYRGFGFAIFESMFEPVDFGVRVTTKENTITISMANVVELVNSYHPNVIVVPDCTCNLLRCSEISKSLINSVINMALSSNLVIRQYKRTNIRECFSAQFHINTRHEIAKAIGDFFPELSPRVPKKRKPWTSDGQQMPLFDAVSLVFTYYYFEYLQLEN